MADADCMQYCDGIFSDELGGMEIGILIERGRIYE
jgi:hypothetical protein